MSGILTAFSGGAFGELVLDISGKASPDIPALLSAAGWIGVAQPVRLLNTGNVNTLVIPSSLGLPDLTVDNASATALIGGVKNGGTALRTQIPIKVRNLGKVYGGGGQGGNGGSAWVSRTVQPGSVFQYASGSAGVGGAGQGFDSATSLTIVAAQTGQAGGSGHLGATGSFGGGTGRGVADAIGGTGGTGGAWGVAGNGGQGDGGYSGDYDNAGATTAHAGLAAGYYADGYSLIAWIAVGDCRGRTTG